MLKNNKVTMALALVMAIVLWAYVLASDNQASTNTLRNIPITFANMETLTENNLVVLETERDTVNITFSGQRTAPACRRTGQCDGREHERAEDRGDNR